LSFFPLPPACNCGIWTVSPVVHPRHPVIDFFRFPPNPSFPRAPLAVVPSGPNPPSAVGICRVATIDSSAFSFPHDLSQPWTDLFSSPCVGPSRYFPSGSHAIRVLHPSFNFDSRNPHSGPLHCLFPPFPPPFPPIPVLCGFLPPTG